jgi:hypothetical protein
MSTDKAAYATGETMTASVSMANVGRPAVVDLLVFEVLPDGDQVVCITPLGPQPGRLSQPSSLVPWSPGLNISRPIQLGQPVFTHKWAPSDAAGPYKWVVAAIRPGSLADNRIDPGDILSVASAPLAFLH